MNLKTKSTTFEVEAGWRLVMVPLAETPLFSRDSLDSRKLGSRAVRGSWGQQTGQLGLKSGFLVPVLELMPSGNSQEKLI